MPTVDAPAAAPVAIFDQQILQRLRRRARSAMTAPRSGDTGTLPVTAVFDWGAVQCLRPAISRGGVATEEPAPAAPPSVLVVDDDASIRTLVQTALTDEGYEVLVAPDGKRGLDLVAERHPTLVLLDMQMPVMDGPAFCAALAEQRSRPAIVVMTASTEAPAFRAQCAAADTLGKPFALDELYAVVGRHTI